jgi:sugar phosphate isomerase/epimerase
LLPMFALSTSWNAAQHSRAKDIIKEIKDLGFEQIELNYNLSSTMVEQMVAFKNQGFIKVVSIHNFCPIPKGISRQMASPDIFSLSALDEHRRKKAVGYTKNTIDTASRIGAEVVVLHLGKVQIQDKIKELAALAENKQRQEFIKLKTRMAKERAAKSKRFFSQALKSLDALYSYALKQKVKLGIENRYYFCEIPIPEEMEIILTKFPAPPVYYWHDVGHAQVYENLKFFKHRTILEKFSQRMIGIHLHDIEGINDHRAPLQGKFDFTLLKPYIKRDTLKVLEPHYPATKEEVMRGRDYLRKLFEN